MENIVSVSSILSAILFDQWRLLAVAAKFFIYVSSFLAVGLMVFQLFLGNAEECANINPRNVVVGAVIVATIATIFRVLVQAGRLMDDGFAGMLDPEIIAISLEGPLGQSTYARLAGLGFILISAAVATGRTATTVGGALLVAGSFALTGHAMREPQLLLTLLVSFHLLAVSYWWGALLPLYRMAEPSADLRHAAKQAEIFGKRATIVVPLLIIAGGLFYFFVTGNLFTLLNTSYGNMVLVKIGIVAIVLAFAALNKLRLVPDLAENVPNAASRFRRSLKVEALVFLCVFAATALLTTSFVVPTF